MKKLRMCLWLMFMFYALAIASAILNYSAIANGMVTLTILTALTTFGFGICAVGAVVAMADAFMVYEPVEQSK